MYVTKWTYHKIKIGTSKRKHCRDRKMAKVVKILTILMLRRRSLLFGLLDQQFEQAGERAKASCSLEAPFAFLHSL